MNRTTKMAMAMYDKYCEEVGGKAFNGDLLPKAVTFFADHTKQKQVQAWIQAAKTAAQFLVDDII